MLLVPQKLVQSGGKLMIPILPSLSSGYLSLFPTGFCSPVIRGLTVVFLRLRCSVLCVPVQVGHISSDRDLGAVGLAAVSAVPSS